MNRIRHYVTLFAAALFIVLGTVSVGAATCSSDYAFSEDPSVLGVDGFKFKMMLKVPRIYDNNTSKGYRKYQAQKIEGEMYLIYRSGEMPEVVITNLVNKTQKLSNATSDPQEIAFVARILAAQNPPIGIYFISEDIFTLASYYWIDMKDKGILPDGWKVLPPDELDGPMPDAAIMLEDTGGKEPEKVSITRDTGDMNADGEVV